MHHDLTPHDLPLADLTLLPGNPRKGDIGAVSESMRVNGVYQPIIVNKGTKTGRPNEIIAGNHRAQAAKALGHETIPAIVLDLTDEEAKRIALADNRTSDLADYDNGALLLMLQDLPDLAGTGYDGDDLDDLLADLTPKEKEALTDVDDAPSEPKTPITRPGDVFNLGPHRLLINPTGAFTLGGPDADTGLTGRKIIVDTYGGYARHGGGAFSGKDPSKVDRSAAYAARQAAITLIANGYATECEVQLAYAIGIPEPVSIHVDTKGTGNTKAAEKALTNIDFTPTGITQRLNLRQPIYANTAVYGHFGRPDFPWEQPLNL